MRRHEHYARAEQLTADALAAVDAAKKLATQQQQARNDAHLYLRAAAIHAALASVDFDVELVAEQETPKPARPKPGPPTVRGATP